MSFVSHNVTATISKIASMENGIAYFFILCLQTFLLCKRLIWISSFSLHSVSFISITNYITTLKKIPCELLEFSLSTRHLFFLGFLFISAFPESHPRSCRLPAVSSEQPLLRSSSLSVYSSAPQSLSGWMRSRWLRL